MLLASLTHAENAKESNMLGLRTTVYSVNDMEKSKQWYTKAFGISPYFDEAYYVGFNIGGYELGLMPAQEGAHKSDNVIAYWGVEDIDAEYQRLLELGAIENSPIADVGGGIRLGTVKDPFGNVLGIIYNPIFNNK